MKVNLVTNEFIAYCKDIKADEIDLQVVSEYWVKIFKLLITLYSGDLFFNQSALVLEESYCFLNGKKLHLKFIFLNFLGNVIITFTKYDILLWYKIGKTIGVDVDKEIEKILEENQ